ncbi:CaiB/BaiF CoA-transferase family protein [Ramlibacter tataouinensis]|uniref:CaiB/BaiF CoA transferase family protein n=1 Tax=Ramlibacter tataouinensis TaxID=94132 RepID=UPI0022F3AC5D|nr:CaiB/BaiF CoA-transferase family protein [Ramlibacter tataouinensis]WBY01069.1 CaiB/BaiF CoA-transferase family protein [Ramlibacter tataouinensis]
MNGVLSGLRVLEFAAIGPVPWTGMLLADLGASVVRIERPGSASERDTLGAVRRGRMQVELDLKSTAGREAAERLVAQADVLLEGLRPGVMERLGLGPDAALKLNPKLVYGRMTGWGQEGPMAQQAGHDINYIALTGALHAIGGKNKPVPPLNLIGDFGGGGAFLLIGVLAALWQVKASGRGQVVDAAMVDGSAALMAMIYGRLLLGQWTDQRASNPLDGGVPWYDTYRTADGKFMAVGALEPQFYQELLDRLGLAGSVPDRKDSRNWPAIRQRFEEVFASRTRDEWARHFAGSDACVSPVLSLAEAPHDAHLASRGTFAGWGGGHVPASAPRFNGERPAVAAESRRVSADEALARWARSS